MIDFTKDLSREAQRDISERQKLREEEKRKKESVAETTERNTQVDYDFANRDAVQPVKAVPDSMLGRVVAEAEKVPDFSDTGKSSKTNKFDKQSLVENISKSSDESNMYPVSRRHY